MSILGVGHYLDETGGINLTSLLILCAVFGFTGSFISLFMSKFIAKRTTGTRIIAQPRTADEQWLVRTVDELARKANRSEERRVGTEGRGRGWRGAGSSDTGGWGNRAREGSRRV